MKFFCFLCGISFWIGIIWGSYVYNPDKKNYVYDTNKLYAIDTCYSIRYDSDSYYNYAYAFECISSSQLRLHYWDTYGDTRCDNGDTSDSSYDYYSSDTNFEFYCGGSNSNAFEYYFYEDDYYDCPASYIDSYSVRGSVTGLCSYLSGYGYYKWGCDTGYLTFYFYSDKYCEESLGTSAYSYCNATVVCDATQTYKDIGYGDASYEKESSDTSSNIVTTVVVVIVVVTVVFCVVVGCFFYLRHRKTYAPVPTQPPRPQQHPQSHLPVSTQPPRSQPHPLPLQPKSSNVTKNETSVVINTSNLRRPPNPSYPSGGYYPPNPMLSGGMTSSTVNTGANVMFPHKQIVPPMGMQRVPISSLPPNMQPNDKIYYYSVNPALIAENPNDEQRNLIVSNAPLLNPNSQISSNPPPGVQAVPNQDIEPGSQPEGQY